MANWYINPGLGTGTNAGTSWANAFNSTTTAWTDAITASSAGDDFYVNAASTCSNASAQTLTFKGTAASPNRVFSCSTITNNPPVAADLGVGAAFTTTGASAQTITGHVYLYGVVTNVGTGTTIASYTIGNATASEVYYDSCTVNLNVTVANSLVVMTGASASAAKVTFNNTTVKFAGGTGAGFTFNAIQFFWKNTASAIATGSQAAIANLFQSGGRSAIVICDGVDFVGGVGIVSGKNIVGAVNASQTIQLINCKTAAGAAFATPTVPGATTDLVVTDSGATGYRQERYAYQGTLTTSTTVFNNASDGVTPISWHVVTTANAKRQSPFECFDIVQWVAAGTYAASLIQITSATASLLNSDIWVETEYLGNASFPISSQVSSGPATQLTTGASLAAGTWAHGSLGHDYQLAIPSFSTNLGGYVRFKVKVAKASLTVNIDPAVTVA